MDSLQQRKQYLIAQDAFIQMFGLKEGSMVEITCISADDAGGWNNCWADGMDETVGQQVHITGIDEYGIHLSNDWQYPFFCLKSLGCEKFLDAEIELDSGDYSAKIYSNGESIEVGCQKISFDTVEKIYNTMLTLKELSKPTIVQVAKKTARKVAAKKVAAKKVARRR